MKDRLCFKFLKFPLVSDSTESFHPLDVYFPKGCYPDFCPQPTAFTLPVIDQKIIESCKRFQAGIVVDKILESAVLRVWSTLYQELAIKNLNAEEGEHYEIVVKHL